MRNSGQNTIKGLESHLNAKDLGLKQRTYISGKTSLWKPEDLFSFKWGKYQDHCISQGPEGKIKHIKQGFCRKF